jgi:hypothetical protein
LRTLKTRVVAILLVALLSIAVLGTTAEPAHAQVVTTTGLQASTSDCKPYPQGAQPPVQCYWDTVTVKNGIGTSVACISDDNPLGYYTSYTYYYGWSYVDANGVSFVGWFADGQSGPYTIVGSYSWIECGTGG